MDGNTTRNRGEFDEDSGFDSSTSRCTCDEKNWDSIVCPFAADVYNDHTTKCTCCDYCANECYLEI